MSSLIGTVTASRLNLRRDPSVHHPPIVSLPRGTEMEVLGHVPGWYQVRFAGQEGYVSASFLSVRPAPPEAREPEGPGGAAAAPVAAGAGFLLGRAELQRVPLAPDRPIPITPELSAPARTAAGAWNRVGGLLGAMSEAISLPPAAAVSVLCVESGGAGFVGGRMVIRFENHVFFRLWGRSHPDDFARHFAFDPRQRWKEHRFRASEAEPWSAFHGNHDGEWRVFEHARGLDETAALKSISMGAPQIMGFNHGRIGYRTAREMFDAFSRDARFHVLGMFDFIRSDPAMLEALRSRSFEQFARRYNGSGQAARYGALIQQHCDACEPLLPTTPPFP